MEYEFCTITSHSQDKPVDRQYRFDDTVKTYFEPHPLHQHDYFEFEFVYDGKCQQLINNRIYMTKPGDSYLILPGQYHKYYIGKEAELKLFTLKFSQNFIDPGLERTLMRQRSMVFETLTDDNELADCIAVMRGETGDAYAELIVRGAIERLCVLLLRKTDFVSDVVKPAEADVLLEIISFIYSNYREKITLELLASRANLSREYFCRYFKTNMGVSPLTFINEIRLSSAAALLRNSNCLVKQAAYECGFNSLTNFRDMFTKKYNMTPEQYKKVNITSL